MRKIVAGLFMSLDGVVEAPEAWTGPYFTPEIGQHVGSLMAAGDTLLLGRVTYQTFAAAFAGNTSGDPIPAQMNAVPKVVVSNTLDKADWTNSTLINRNLTEQITELKRQPGATINVSGSITLIGWLLRERLFDELDLLVFPVVIGRGKRLFDSGDSQIGVTLTGSQTFDSGVLHLTYVPA